MQNMPAYLVTFKRKMEQYALAEIEADSWDEAESRAQMRAETGDGLNWEESFGGREAPWVDEISFRLESKTFETFAEAEMYVTSAVWVFAIEIEDEDEYAKFIRRFREAEQSKDGFIQYEYR